MKILTFALLIGVFFSLSVVIDAYGDGTITTTVYPLQIDGNDTTSATPFAVFITISGATSVADSNVYVKVYDGTAGLYVWNDGEWKNTATWSNNPVKNLDSSGNWSGWLYLKSNGRAQFKSAGRKVGDTSNFATESNYHPVTLLNMSSTGSWIYDSGNPPAGKVIVALGGSGNILGTWVAEDNGITDQFPSAANYPGSPATGFWEMSVLANTSIVKLQARNVDNTVYAEDTTGWNSSSAGAPHELTDVSLPVGLSSFTAIRIDSGVMIQWRTETETDHVGWDIYRSEKKDGKFVKITDDLIKGSGNSGMPHTYQYVDKTAIAGRQYYYYLEDFDIFGNVGKSDIIGISDGKAPSPKNSLSTTWGAIKQKH